MVSFCEYISFHVSYSALLYCTLPFNNHSFTPLFNKHAISHLTDTPSPIHRSPSSPIPTSAASTPHPPSLFPPSSPSAARPSDSSTASCSRSERSISSLSPSLHTYSQQNQLHNVLLQSIQRVADPPCRHARNLHVQLAQNL